MKNFKFNIAKVVGYMGGRKTEYAIETVRAKTKDAAIEKLFSYGYSVGQEVK